MGRLTSASGIWCAGVYGYDARGNLTSRGAQAYSFDIANRLLSAPGKASYGYDGHGRRTWVSYADGSWKVQFYSLSGELLYTKHSSQGETRHIGLGRRLLAEQNSASGLRYAHTDALGSPVAWTNASGQLITRTRFEPYGGTAAGTNPTGIGYTGHVNDADTGLVYMQQRYYDPLAGRFLSVDPVVTDPQTGGEFNRYAYVGNDPMDKTDPTGEFCWFGSFGTSCEAGATGFGAWLSQNLIRTSVARSDYQSAAQSLVESAGRSDTKVAARAATPQPARAVVQATRPSTGPKPGSGGTVNRTNASWDTAGRVAGTLGKVSAAVTVVAGAAEIARSSNPGRSVAGVGGSVVGGVAGGEGGATGGALIGGVLGGPPGAAVGAIIGGVLGSAGGGIAGHEAGTAAYDEAAGPQ